MFKRLIKLIRQEKVSLFIGAGFSIEANAPSVQKLKETILANIDDLDAKQQHNDDNLADLSEFYVEEICNGSRNELVSLLKELFSFNPASMKDHEMLAKIPHFHNIFTTNYDRLIEAGADVAGLRLIDRFVGALSPIFRSSRMDVDMHYNPPGIRGEPRYLEGVARFTKLHGSLDWINVGEDIRRIGLPFGAKTIQPFLETAGFDASYSSLMIYPNSAKDRETAEYPYVELFRDFASALCRPNSTLVTYGYSFGDDHINRVIRDMLTIPSTHLVIIDYSDSSGRIIDKYEQWGHQSQMSLIIGKDIANITDLVNYYLPKPSIDRASIRMADILKQRFTQPAKKEQEGESEA